MILLYQLPETEKGELVQRFFERVNLPFTLVGTQQAGHTFSVALAGELADKPVVDAVTDTAIFFDAEFNEEAARNVLEPLAQAGIFFHYQVLFSDDLAEKTLAAILREHANYQAFLKQITHLQKLIDGCGRLNQDDYDPDRWSALKFAVADANDYLDAVFSDEAQDLANLKPQDVVDITNALQDEMNRLLTYRKPQ